jgi:TRAP-type C4-dicarboxylate transport system substrate-binding protein
MNANKIFLVTFLVLLLAAPASAATYKMRVTHQWPETHHLSADAKYFKNIVEQKTGGKVEVEIYPAAQAFKPNEVIKGVATGSIEAGITTNFEWAGMLPIIDVVLIPWLVTDLPVIEKVLSGEVGARLFKAMESKGVVPLMWMLQCRTNLYTSNEAPLLLPKDFKGKKMRGTSKIMNLGSEALGASTMSISGPEVYMALQRGTIDIGLTGIDAALARHYYEIQKYGTVVNNFTVMEPVFVYPKFWNSMPVDLRNTIKECGLAVQKKSIEDSEKARNVAITELQKKMIIHIQTELEEQAWKAVMRKPVFDYFLEKTGKEGKELVDLIQKLGK